MLHILGNTSRTRLFVGVGPRRPVKTATRSAKKAIERGTEFRRAKRPCPICKFKWVMVSKTSKNMLCLRCHLISPSVLTHARTLEKVER